MTSNGPLRSGGWAARLHAGRRWLQQSAPGRVILAGAALKLAAGAVSLLAPPLSAALDVIDTIGSVLILAVALYLLGLGIGWARRRLLWRVRRKLILFYVFVGLVPGVIIVIFVLLAGSFLFLNVSSYILQSRVQALVDEARALAEAAALEAGHAGPGSLESRLAPRLAAVAARIPHASLALVPASPMTCAPGAGGQSGAPSPPPPLRLGPWSHLPPPAALPDWIGCGGFAGLIAYDTVLNGERQQQLVVRAAARPFSRQPRWAIVVDLPVTRAVEQHLREETGVRPGRVSVRGGPPRPEGRALDAPDVPGGPDASGDGGTATAATSALEQGWVTLLQVHDWESGAVTDAAVAMQLDPREVYARIIARSTGQRLGQFLLGVLAFIGVLFLTIQVVALVLGFALARQITGAVHDLFTGTLHLRNRDFTHQIPVRARDQLGELAESFNTMTGEITKLIRENAEKARMEQEMRAAREIQRRLLPSAPLRVPGLAITAFCEPAREVAGDYFDFLAVSETQLGVLIADVSGKGLPAGLYMAQLKVIAQSLARAHPSPREFLRAVNRLVAANIDSSSFITMAYGVIDLERGQMTYSRAGHCPLIRVPGDRPVGLRRPELVTPDGLVLGLKIDDGAMFDAMIDEVTIPLAAGDLLVFYTDGVTETMNEAFDCYGEARLARLLSEYAHLPFEQLRSFIVADLRAFSGSADPHDDMTMILLRVEGTRRDRHGEAAGAGSVRPASDV